jgi:hypothetical protein
MLAKFWASGLLVIGVVVLCYVFYEHGLHDGAHDVDRRALANARIDRALQHRDRIPTEYLELAAGRLEEK